MNACNIFKTKNYYKIITQSETEDGFFLSGEPVFFVPLDSSAHDLGTRVFEALANSRKNVRTPRRDEYPALEKEMMKQIQEKSYANLYRNSNSCDVRFEEGTIRIYPEKYFNPAKPGQGLVWVESDMVEIGGAEEKKEEVGAAIAQILDKQYKFLPDGKPFAGR